MFDSIAVPRGNGCCNRVIAAFAIGLLRLRLARPNSALDVYEQALCHSR
jgi:hypothetical protein